MNTLLPIRQDSPSDSIGMFPTAMRSAGTSTEMLKVALNDGSSQDGMKRRSEAGSKLVAMVRRLPAGAGVVHGEET